MPDDAYDSLSDDNMFWVHGRVYVIAPFPRPVDPVALLRKLTLAQSDRSVGVVVFTDLDLAERFVESLGDKGRDQKPLTFPAADDFANALTFVLETGVTHVAFDPGIGPSRFIDIPRVVAAIRNRKR